MKYKLTAAAALLLSVSLLAGCTSRPDRTETAPTEKPTWAPVATAAPTETPGMTAAPTETPGLTATPTPPPTVPDPSAAPEKNGMYDLLCGLMDSYHPGTAGSSLKAAWYAASMVDFSQKNGADIARAGALAWDRDMTNEFGETLEEKLKAVFRTALELPGQPGLLSDCGFTEPWDYSTREIRGTFASLFPALGLTAPVMIRLWTPADDVNSLVSWVTETEDLSAASLTKALQGAALREGETILSLAWESNVVRADMNEAFGQRVRSLGTSGERAVLGSLTNTLLDAFGAERLILTVGGETLETGHNVYSDPLTFVKEDLSE